MSRLGDLLPTEADADADARLQVPMDGRAPVSRSAAFSTRTGSLTLSSANENFGYTAVVWFDSEMRTIPLAPSVSYSVGRGPNNAIMIAHSSVSREHAVIHVGDVPHIEDLRSRNGIRVRGERIASNTRIPIDLGVTVQIGAASILLHRGEFVVDASTDALSSTRPTTRPPGPDHSDTHVTSRGPSRLPLGLLPSQLILRDAKMLELYRLVEVVATSDISVLVLGETGVGKEFLAESIHSCSPRRKHAFVKLNCAALPEGLLESELFGYEKGAFSGALSTKAGLIESVDGGTLFLDEVAELTLSTQAKLLRVLETGEVMRLGALRPRKVSVRVVSATNRNVKQLIARGLFRADLYYRFNGITLTVPPLRERLDDIPALAEFFAARFARRAQRPPPAFATAAVDLLKAYHWAGNVRELKNVIERALLLSTGNEIGADALAFDGGEAEDVGFERAAPSRRLRDIEDGEAEALAMFAGEATTLTNIRADSNQRADSHRAEGARPNAGARPDSAHRGADELREELARRERDRIVEALARAGGNQADAAKVLGISRRTLSNRLDAFAIARPRKGRTAPRG